jgi:hypothetical protein
MRTKAYSVKSLKSQFGSYINNDVLMSSDDITPLTFPSVVRIIILTKRQFFRIKKEEWTTNIFTLYNNIKENTKFLEPKPKLITVKAYINSNKNILIINKRRVKEHLYHYLVNNDIINENSFIIVDK